MEFSRAISGAASEHTATPTAGWINSTWLLGEGFVLSQRDRAEHLQRNGIFILQSCDPSDMLDHATSEIASGSKLGIDATKKIPGEGFQRPRPPLIRMNKEVRQNVDALFRNKM